MNGFSGAVFKGFSTRAEADQFISQGRHSSAARSSYSGDFVSTASRSRLIFIFLGLRITHTGGYFFRSGGSRRYHSSGPSSHEGGHCSSSVPTLSEQKSLPVVYSDGCCYGNGHQIATGGVGVYWGDHHPQ